MTTLWLWLNSTELNWTLTVRDVDGNCFALCTPHRVRLSRSHGASFSLSCSFALCLYLALAISLSLVEISVQNFKFQCWVSQWLHTLTNTHTQTHAHIHAHTNTHSRIPIDSFQFCFRCPFQFVRDRAPLGSLSFCPQFTLFKLCVYFVSFLINYSST